MSLVTGATTVGRHASEPPSRIDSPRQLHRWLTIAFLHWAYDPPVVQALLPPGLTVDTFDDQAWVGVIPFRLHIRLPGVPFVPWTSRFLETNVRTYVRGPDGAPGIWFLSLDAARLGAVAVARAGWNLPYMWAGMRLTRDGNVLTYECRRRWPRAHDARSRIVLELGESLAIDDTNDLERFVTARWTLFSRWRGGLARAQAEHVRWPLRRAAVVECDDGLLRVTGLPSSAAPTWALYSDGVDVRLGGRRAVAL